MKGMLKYHIFLLIHKKIFVRMLFLFTLLCSFYSFIKIFSLHDGGSMGVATQFNFLMNTEYSDHIVLLLLVYMLPLLAALPISDSWMSERRFQPSLFARESKRNFIASKCIVCFISGFLLVFLPLLIGFVCETIILSQNQDGIISLQTLTPENDLIGIKLLYPLYQLYFSHPTMFILFYITVMAIYAGVNAVLSALIGMILEKRIFVYLSAFMLSLGTVLICGVLPEPFSTWYIQNLMFPYAPGITYHLAVILWVMFYLGLFVVCYILIRKKEKQDE